MRDAENQKQPSDAIHREVVSDAELEEHEEEKIPESMQDIEED